MKISLPVVLLMVLAIALPSSAKSSAATADSESLSLPEAEARFLEVNPQLIASRLNVDVARAAIVQAELWNNPNLSVDQNIYNRYTKRWLDVTKTGNTDIQIQQLFQLAGKRGKQIALAEAGASAAEQTFYDLMRTLKLELRTDFFDLYFLQHSVGFYDRSIGDVTNTVDAIEQTFEQRSILLSEVLRLKSLLLTLESERLGLENRITEIEGDLSVLLRDTSRRHPYYVAAVSLPSLDSLAPSALELDSVLALARRHRPDLTLAESNVRVAEASLELQHALAVPDVTVGGHWSRAGNYIPDYYGLTVSIDLPLFNRNQGGIAAAERVLDASRVVLDNAGRQLEKEVTSAFRKARDTERLYRNFDRRFAGQYRQLADGMIASYRNRDISVIQFTDFYESYRSSVLQTNQLQNDRLDAFEGLNFAAGLDVVHIR